MGGDIIDYTLLQKKGILNRARALDEVNKIGNLNEGKVLDFTSGAVNNSLAQSGASTNLPASGSGTFADFFGAVDSGVSSATGAIASASSFPITANPINNQVSGLGVNCGINEMDFKVLKINLENAEFKLEHALKRIEELERKITGIKI